MRRSVATVLQLALASVAFATVGSAQARDTARFTRTTAMIPMRDGVRLNTVIFVPKSATGPLPILLKRTPYGVASSRPFLAGTPVDEDFIFAYQDLRGRYQSEGKFVMQRAVRDAAHRGDPHAIDEATDAYDSIDWLVKNVANNNGRVGMFGVSYDGWTTAMALTDPHPALKAVSPQASPADMWLGDDFHHNGAFRLSYGFEYASMMETGKENFHFSFDTYDTYEWYLKLGALSNVNPKVLHGDIPTWNDFVNHPDYDAFWQRQAIVPSLRQVTVPTLNVAGWWDQEDFYGPVTIYEALEKFDTKHLNFLVVGPWNHGGWNAAEGRKLGNIDFGSATSKFFRDSIEAPFFEYYLRDRGAPHQPEALVFESGSNRWRTYDAWPPRTAVTDRKLYFADDGRLTFDPPSQPNAFDAYVSDPKHPVPYRHRPIQPTYDPRGSTWYTWLTEDQRFVQDRPDVLSWKTDPLTEDVTIAGDIMARLFASTTGTDADWIVKLIDVYPEDVPNDPKMGGYEFMVSNEVFRARYRDGIEQPKPLTPGKVTKVEYSLHTQSYAFRKGHRIMVQVQSSWFPLIDRNPQKFVPNIFAAKDSDFQPATVRVFRSAEYPSGITLPVTTSIVP
jgi:putative CocE/NonD family hydrolase